MTINYGSQPGQVTPKKGNGPDAANDRPVKTHINTNATILAAAQDLSNDEPKDFATMRSQFAKRGYTLTRSRRVPCGSVTLTVTRWEMHRTFSTLTDLQGYLHQVTGAAL